jgi:hypothetical protein
MGSSLNGTGVTFSNGSTQAVAWPGNTGTVTSVATGNGLQGGTITSSGTLSIAAPATSSVGSYVAGSTTAASNSGAAKTFGGSYSCWAAIYNGCNMTYTAQAGTWKYLGTFYNGSGPTDIGLMVRIA